METNQVETILKKIQYQLKPDDNTFDQKLATYLAIQQWYKDGQQGELPHQPDLVAWGILTEDEVPASRPSKDVIPDEGNDDEEERLFAGAEDSVEASTDIASTEEPDEFVSAVHTVRDHQVHEVEASVSQASPDAPFVAEDEPIEDEPNLEDEVEAETSVITSPLFKSDDPLSQVYETALAWLKNGNYYAAKQSLADLQLRTIGELRKAVTTSYHEASDKLAEAVRPLIDEAETFASRYPDNFAGQRRYWERILEVDQDNETTLEALKYLNEQESIATTRREIGKVREDIQQAENGMNLERMNRAFGDATGLSHNNTALAIQPELDQLVQLVTVTRQRLRDKLGAASTLAVSGNQREAYRQAREFLGTAAKMLDAAGILGAPDSEVDTNLFYRKAREIFLSSLQNLAQQRQATAEGEKHNPRQAKKTLEDAEKRLTDDILTQEDRNELEPTLQAVRKAIQEADELILKYAQAEEAVLAAQIPGVPPAQQLQHYRNAQIFYPDYPKITVYLQQAEEALAAVQAGHLQDKMTLSRRELSQENFAEALDILKQARQESLNLIPHPTPGSEYAHRLAEIVRLEENIIEAEADYRRLARTWQTVDELLTQYAQDKQADLLATARNYLDQLNPQDAGHQRTRHLRTRLTEFLGVDESWRLGVMAYQGANWEQAVETLQQVAINPGASQKQQADQMWHRAQASFYVAEARMARQAQDWRTAIEKYNAAERLFTRYGSDDFTEAQQRECAGALTDLKPLEENDKVVRDALQKAQRLLRDADQIVKARTSLLGKVEPLPQYQEVIKILEEVRYRDTTLKEELEQSLRKARDDWRNVYLEGMRQTQASNSTDMGIWQKAASLGEVLNEHNLLYEARDKALYQEIQEKFLEMEYTRLNGDPTADPAQVEINRRRRWEIAPVKTDNLRQQYYAAIERRVEAELGHEKAAHGTEAAYVHLQKAILQPELYQSERLFAEFIHLCWELRHWQEAQRQADSLAFRTHLKSHKEKSLLWVGLNRAVQRLEVGDVAAFEAEINNLTLQVQPVPELPALLGQERQWLVEWRINRLLELGRVASGENTPVKNIEAAQWYTQAYLLNETDPRVRSGLADIGKRLEAGLLGYATQAEKLKPRADLEISIQEGEQLERTITSLLAVSEALGMTPSVKNALDGAVIGLQERLRLWQRVKAELGQIRVDLKTALTRPFAYRQSGEGGWLLEDLLERFNALIVQVRGERDILQLLTSTKSHIETLIEKATHLNDKAWTLLNGLEAEEFADVIKITGELERLWNDYSLDGFGNLEEVIRYRYPLLKGKEIRTLAEHRRQAQEQLNDLTAWEEWSKSVTDAYNNAKTVFDKVKKPLAELREDDPLRDIAERCRHLRTLCARFEELFATPPEKGPLSTKSAMAKARVLETWEAEVLSGPTSYRNKANELLAQLEKDDKAFNEQLRRLRGAMQNLENGIREYERRKDSRFRALPFPMGQYNVAEKSCQECDKLDPRHTDVEKYRRRLDDIKRSYNIQ